MFFEYDGTSYHGWQIQPRYMSVQQRIQEAFFLFLRTEVKVTAAGRTDTGVHARNMAAHFDLEEPKDCDWMKQKLNGILPVDIAIHSIVPVRPDAHARFDARSRTYRYYMSNQKSSFLDGYVWYTMNVPDYELMNQAAAMLTEFVDFTSFSKLHTDTKTNDCRITRAEWVRRDDSIWVFTITADRFLRNMVRAIVGTLMQVGRHQITVAEFRDIILKKDRCSAGDSAPAHGLFLEDIEYPENLFQI